MTPFVLNHSFSFVLFTCHPVCIRSCCDFRRAVIIMNVIAVILAIIGLATTFAGAQLLNSLSTNQQEEELIDNFDSTVLVNKIFGFLSLLMAAIAIVGAVKFNVWLVGLHIVWLIISTITLPIIFAQDCNAFIDEYDKLYDTDTSDEDCVSTWNVFYSVVFSIIWIYPHIGFILEVKNGIMTKETYPREEFSCCCV